MRFAEDPEPIPEKISRARAGDGHALRSLLTEHLGSLHAYVRSQVPQELRQLESVSDIVQSVCRAALQHDLFEYRGMGQFKCWLYRAVTMRVQAKLRRAHALRRDIRRGPVRLDPELLDSYSRIMTPSEVLSRREDLERLEQAFDRLPPADSELLALRYLAEVSPSEIATEFGVTIDTLNKRLSRARVRLSAILDEEEKER